MVGGDAGYPSTFKASSTTGSALQQQVSFKTYKTEEP